MTSSTRHASVYMTADEAIMTTNFERGRALHWGAAILSQLLIEASAPIDLVERARKLVAELPNQAVIDALSEGASIKLTPSQVRAIRGTRDALERLTAAGVAITTGGRTGVEATLRHFPLPDDDNAGFLLWPAAPPSP